MHFKKIVWPPKKLFVHALSPHKLGEMCYLWFWASILVQTLIVVLVLSVLQYIATHMV